MLHAVAWHLAALALVAGTVEARPASGPARLQPSSRLVGRVVDARTRAGIGAIRVCLDDGTAETTTSTDGAFAFDDVSPGRHGVVAVLAGFTPSAPVTVVIEPDTDAQVEIEYTLGLTAEVRGAMPEPPSSPPRASLGLEQLTGPQVASAVGGLDDVLRVMQLRPGVAASQDDRNDLMVRGGGAFETAVRMDGFELPTASHFAWPGGAGGGLSLIPSAVIDRATVETSGFPVAYGERASALLDIDTRTGATRRLRGRADLSAGGVLALVEGRLPGGDGATGSWMASARRSILEFAFSRGDSRATPGYVETIGNVDVPISKVHHVHVLALRSTDSLDVDWTAAPASTVTEEQTMVVGGVSLRSTWTPRTETYASISWASNDVSLREVEQTATSFDDRSLERFLRARAEIRRSFGRGARLLAGTALKRSAVNFDLQDGAYRNAWNIVVPTVQVSWHDQFTDVAAYSDLSWAPGPVTVGMGVRADRSGVTSSWYASPRGRVEYRVSGQWRVMGGWGVYRQDIPNVWLGSNPANRQLDPVKCVQTTLGVEDESWRGAVATAEGFAKSYTGYPIDPSVPSRVLISTGADFESPLVGRLVPSGRVSADGADLSLSQHLPGSVTLAMSYSYWNVREYNLAQQWIRADFDIRHQGRVWMTWHGARRWSASALWRYASGRPYTPYDVAASIKANVARFDRTRVNAVTYAPYHRLDVRADRLFVMTRATVSLFAEIDNVYNRDNLYIYDWSKTLKQPVAVYQWGLMPVAGVRVEF